MSIIKLVKEADDPICPRASIGGDNKQGFYCVYRGNKNKEIIPMIKKILKELEKHA